MGTDDFTCEAAPTVFGCVNEGPGSGRGAGGTWPFGGTTDTPLLGTGTGAGSETALFETGTVGRGTTEPPLFGTFGLIAAPRTAVRAGFRTVCDGETFVFGV